MKKARKTITMILAFVLVAAIAVGATVAYLQDKTDVAENTFTVGNVHIRLDEAVVDEDGKATDDRTESGNKDIVEGTDGSKYGYKLYPGLSYDKDPTVTVLKGSDDCYVRMTVTVNKGSELVKLMFNQDGSVRFNPLAFFTGVDQNNWEFKFDKSYFEGLQGTTGKEVKLTFWYKPNNGIAHVGATESVTTDKGTFEGTRLPALFTGFTIPADLNNEELATLNGMKIKIYAEAIQEAGFDNAEAAFAALDAQNP